MNFDLIRNEWRHTSTVPRSLFLGIFGQPYAKQYSHLWWLMNKINLLFAYFLLKHGISLSSLKCVWTGDCCLQHLSTVLGAQVLGEHGTLRLKNSSGPSHDLRLVSSQQWPSWLFRPFALLDNHSLNDI